MGFLSRRLKMRLANKATGVRHYEIAQESARLLETTMNPRTFFGRCDDIAFAEERVTGKASAFRADTVRHTKLQIAFIQRLIDAGKRAVLDEAINTYENRWTAAAIDYYNQHR